MSNVISEGSLDAETTTLSQAILNNVKKFEKDLLASTKGYFQLAYAKDNSGQGAIQRLSNQTGFLTLDYANLNLPASIKAWAPNLMVYVTVAPPKHQGSYDHTNKILMIVIGIPKVGTKLDYNATLPYIKAVLRHELEHSKQVRNNPYTNVQDYPWPATTNKAPSGANFGKPQEIENYLTHPSEIEGWVSGMYKFAKTSKMSFTDAMQIQLDRILQSMIKSGANPEESQKVLDGVKEKWSAYQKHRFPKAVVNEALDVEISPDRWQILAGITRSTSK